jgi:hypothetical protein
MRTKIDAHVHIVPAHLLGKTDRRFSVTIEPHGIKRFADGSIYQFMPGYLPGSCYPVDSLIGSMDDMGIEKAVIMQSPCFSLNEEVIHAVQKYPDRLRGSIIAATRVPLEKNLDQSSALNQIIPASSSNSHAKMGWPSKKKIPFLTLKEIG